MLPPAMRNVKLRAASGGFLEKFHFQVQENCVISTIWKKKKKGFQPLIADRFFQKEIPVL